VHFVDEPGVTLCGTLALDVSDQSLSPQSIERFSSGSFKRVSYSESARVPADANLRARKTALAGLLEDACVVEVELRVLDAELQLSARDLRSGRCVSASLEDKETDENGDAEPLPLSDLCSSVAQSFDSIPVSEKF
jgi:hypothetical protein